MFKNQNIKMKIIYIIFITFILINITPKDVYAILYKSTVTTVKADYIGSTRATLYGSIDTNGGASIIDYGFYYGTSSSNMTGKSFGSTNIKGQFYWDIPEYTLKSDTTYYYYFYAKNSQGTSIGSTYTFKTLPSTEVTVSNMPSKLILEKGKTVNLQGSILCQAGIEVVSVAVEGFFEGSLDGNGKLLTNTSVYGTTFNLSNFVIDSSNIKAFPTAKTYKVNVWAKGKGGVAKLVGNFQLEVTESLVKDVTVNNIPSKLVVEKGKTVTMQGSISCQAGIEIVSVAVEGFFEGSLDGNGKLLTNTSIYGTTFDLSNFVIDSSNIKAFPTAKTYNVNVWAKGKGGVAKSVGSFQLEVVKATLKKLSAPQIVQPLSNFIKSDSDIVLEWKPVEGAVSYEVKIRDITKATDESGDLILDTKTVNGTKVTISKSELLKQLTIGNKYRLWVGAYEATKNVALRGNAEFVMTAVENTNSSTNIKIGDYVQMGKYYDEPILWRCVDIDQNGPLMLSDKILTIKPFDAAGDHKYLDGTDQADSSHGYRTGWGSNLWQTSNMRSWLNSTASAGNVKWLDGCPPTKDMVWEGFNAYADEKGFLAEGNFTIREQNAIKSVTQKSLLDEIDVPKLKEGGTTIHTWNDNIPTIGLQNYDTAYCATRCNMKSIA